MNEMGEPRIKVVAMPKDTNPAGNIFGGWIMSHIDLAGSLATRDLPIESVVTVKVNSLEFREPIYVGDAVSFYSKVIKVGRTSVKVAVEVNAERLYQGERRCLHVTSADITYVSVNHEGKKKPIECDDEYLKALGIERRDAAKR
ncbi:acyl-CoA thioesterase [Sulfurospirillum sp. 1612]|uniref:acyl-CoA thioesterase n=1 Tax=Sulfurospirillum sp. 1612 TaxID=3094835 RepID=UPI002F923DEC